jgi:hypothetical protein
MPSFRCSVPPTAVFKIVNGNRAKSHGGVLGLFEGCRAINKARGKLRGHEDQ